MIVAGVGFRSSCTAADLADLVRSAGRHASVLAAPARKRGAPALGASALLGLPLVLLDDAALAAVQHACSTHSAAAVRATGHGSIAEACALAAGGAGARLVLTRISSACATCAMAES